MDSPRPFDIALRENEKKRNGFNTGSNFPTLLKNCKPTLEALLVWISSPILGASAHWNVVGRFADGILATGVCFTGINTVVFYAGLVTWTLIVMLTFPSFDF